MKTKNQKVLITGSEGLIGKIIQTELSKENKLVLVDNMQGPENFVIDLTKEKIPIKLNLATWRESSR